jgi:hypothetical protein
MVERPAVQPLAVGAAHAWPGPRRERNDIVLIAGGGPVGLALAGELDRRDVSCPSTSPPRRTISAGSAWQYAERR